MTTRETLWTPGARSCPEWSRNARRRHWKSSKSRVRKIIFLRTLARSKPSTCNVTTGWTPSYPLISSIKRNKMHSTNHWTIWPRYSRIREWPKVIGWEWRRRWLNALEDSMRCLRRLCGLWVGKRADLEMGMFIFLRFVDVGNLDFEVNAAYSFQISLLKFIKFTISQITIIHMAKSHHTHTNHYYILSINYSFLSTSI